MRRQEKHLHIMALGIATCALLGGCVSLAPQYARPAMPVPERYPAVAGADQADRLQGGGSEWRDYFVGPELQSLIALSLENSRDLRLAVLKVEEARATYGVQRAEQWPSLGLSVDSTRTRTPADLSLTGRATTGNVFQAGIGLAAWEIDFWGRIRSLKGAALETYLATEAGRQSVELSLVAQVAESYLSLRELDERIALADQALHSRAESLRILGRRVDVGAASKLDLVQAQTLWQQARALKSQLLQAHAAEAARLQFLVGAPVAVAPVAQALADGGIIGVVPDSLPSDLLTRRPDVVAAEHSLKAANARVGAARAAFFPRISLTVLIFAEN